MSRRVSATSSSIIGSSFSPCRSMINRRERNEARGAGTERPQKVVSEVGEEIAQPQSLSPVVDVRFGAVQVRLARDEAEIDAAQALRYRVFYEEMGAEPTAEMARRRRDFDRYDAVCDHL